MRLLQFTIAIYGCKMLMNEDGILGDLKPFNPKDQSQSSG
jgi:hypothetical protein